MYPCLDFTGFDFSWLSRMNIYNRCKIFNYIIDSKWEVREEIATNTITYNHFIEFSALDSLKGTHVLIANGQIKNIIKKIFY